MNKLLWIELSTKWINVLTNFCFMFSLFTLNYSYSFECNFRHILHLSCLCSQGLVLWRPDKGLLVWLIHSLHTAEFTGLNTDWMSLTNTHIEKSSHENTDDLIMRISKGGHLNWLILALSFISYISNKYTYTSGEKRIWRSSFHGMKRLILNRSIIGFQSPVTRCFCRVTGLKLCIGVELFLKFNFF